MDIIASSIALCTTIALISALFLYSDLYRTEHQSVYLWFIGLCSSVYMIYCMGWIRTLCYESGTAWLGRENYHKLLYSYTLYGCSLSLYVLFNLFQELRRKRFSTIVRRSGTVLSFLPLAVASVVLLLQRPAASLLRWQSLVFGISFLLYLVCTLLLLGERQQHSAAGHAIKILLIIGLVVPCSDLSLFRFGNDLFPSFAALPFLCFLLLTIAAALVSNAGRMKNKATTGEIPEESMEKYHISGREREILVKIAAGKSNKEIAEELFVALSTVRTHIYNIFKKLGAKNRIDAINIIKNSRTPPHT